MLADRRTARRLMRNIQAAGATAIRTHRSARLFGFNISDVAQIALLRAGS